MTSAALALDARGVSQAGPRNIGLDAARLLAALLVLLTHGCAVFLPMFGMRAPVTVIMAAFYGVELFFVLSGFLIGRLLFEVAETDATLRGWLIFMVRRWMRTLPVYYVWLAVVLLVLPTPPDVLDKVLHYATMTQNLAWRMPADGWFNQSWTLAVEEWFYLLFSAALLAAVAFSRSRAAVWAVIVAFIALPAAARIVQPHVTDFEHQVYHVAALRLDAIAYGVALARLRHDGSALFRHPLAAGAAGVALVAAGWSQFSYGPWFRVTKAQFNLGQMFLASVGLSLFLAGIVALRLGWAPLVRLIVTGSKLSYGLYLMHLTVIEWVVWRATERGYGPWAMIAACAVGVVALPYLSFRLIEAPIMALRPRQARALRL